MTEDAPAEDRHPLPAGPILLLGGINFTTWPDLKWSRGKSHFALLQSKFDEWHASAPVSIGAVLREDRMGFDFVARVPKGVPKHEWSLDLGDALHNLRSAFDALAWGIAHFNGAEPTHPHRVNFPICTDESQWRKALKGWVGDIPPELRERIRRTQPFTYAPAGGVSVLQLLHELDIQDKHCDSLTVSADLTGVNLDGASFAYEDSDSHAVPCLDMFSDIEFVDGAVLGTMQTGARIREPVEMIVRPALKVKIAHRDTTYDVMPILEQMVTETRRYLDILLSGIASPDDEGWLPMDTGLRPP